MHYSSLRVVYSAKRKRLSLGRAKRGWRVEEKAKHVERQRIIISRAPVVCLYM